MMRAERLPTSVISTPDGGVGGSVEEWDHEPSEGKGRKHGSLRSLNEKAVMRSGSSVRKARRWEYMRDEKVSYGK